MGINEMDFHWRLNWWYRPTQCDGFGTSVTDYYECFCDWKDSMEIHSCPADEADYIDAFIQNLKPDIRLKLESKGRSSTRRLNDIFSDAKFEESMIFLDKAFKKIEAKFEAHRPLFNSEQENSLIVAATYIDESLIDKLAEITVGPQPIQGEDMRVKEYYDQFCSWISKSKAVNDIGDEESHVDEFFYGLRKDLRERVLQSKWKTYRLSDALRRAQIDETFLSWEKDYGHNNANDVFEGMPNPKSKHIDELQVAEDVGDAQSDELVVQIEAESWKIVSLVAACSVLDELTEPDIEEMPHSNSINLDAVRGSCNDMSIEEHGVVDKVLESEPSGGLKQFAAGVQCMNRAKEFKLAEPKMVMVGYQMSDETPELICMKHFEEHNGNNNSTPLIVYIRWIFDPGSVATEHACPNGSTILEIEDTFTPLLVHSLLSLKDIGAAIMLSMPWPSLQPVSFYYRFGNESIEESLPCMKEIEAFVTLLLGSVQVVHRVFVKNQKLHSANYVPLPICVPQIFDPGIAFIGSISTNALNHNQKSDSWGVYKCFADCSKKPNRNDGLDYDLGTGSEIVLMRKINYRISKMSEKEKSEVLVVSFILLAAYLAAKVELYSVLGMYTKEEDTLDGLHIIRQVYDTLVDVLDEGFSTAKLIIQSDMSLEDYIFIIDMDDMVWDPGIHSNCCQNIFRRVGFMISNEMQQGQCMVEKSRIYTIGVDRHIRVGDLSLKYEGVTVLDNFVWAVGQADRLRNIISMIKAGGFSGGYRNVVIILAMISGAIFFPLSHAQLVQFW